MLRKTGQNKKEKGDKSMTSKKLSLTENPSGSQSDHKVLEMSNQPSNRKY